MLSQPHRNKKTSPMKGSSPTGTGTSQQNGSNIHSKRISSYLVAIVIATIAIAIFCLRIQVKTSSNTQDMSMVMNPTVNIASGEVNKIPYYHCKSSNNNTPKYELVLLHGSSFTKENWKKSGILQLFCSDANNNDIAVTALDLSIHAKYEELIKVLDVMQTEKLITDTPISALITPSASGNIILDGILNGKNPSLKEKINWWIPIASNALNKYTIEQLKPAVTDNISNILAIYGNKDDRGKQSSNLLKDSSNNVQVIELQGSHPVYLDQPKEFVNIVIQTITTTTKSSTTATKRRMLRLN